MSEQQSATDRIGRLLYGAEHGPLEQLGFDPSQLDPDPQTSTSTNGQTCGELCCDVRSLLDRVNELQMADWRARDRFILPRLIICEIGLWPAVQAALVEYGLRPPRTSALFPPIGIPVLSYRDAAERIDLLVDALRDGLVPVWDINGAITEEQP